MRQPETGQVPDRPLDEAWRQALLELYRPPTDVLPGRDAQERGVDQEPSPVVEDEIAAACDRLLSL